MNNFSDFVTSLTLQQNQVPLQLYLSSDYVLDIKDSFAIKIILFQRAELKQPDTLET